jgi:hypothetical protein
MKSRTYGGYQLVDLDWHNRLVAGWDGSKGRGYALDLDAVETWLRGARI